jgi:hypothetical protein
MKTAREPVIVNPPISAKHRRNFDFYLQGINRMEKLEKATLRVRSEAMLTSRLQTGRMQFL